VAIKHITKAVLAAAATLAICGVAGVTRAADGVSTSQRDAAGAYFTALASGDAQALAFSIHPDEIIKLRQRLLLKLREEASHDDATLRTRLFGSAMQLAELERQTAASFFVTLSRRLSWQGRAFRDVRWLGSVSESSSLVWVVGRLKPPKDLGTSEVVQLAGLMPYGKDWKAIIPTEIEAQIQDLMDGRGPAANTRATAGSAHVASNGAAAAAGSGAMTPPAGKAAAAPREMLALLDSAEQALIAGKCDTYYKEYLSPNFRRLTPSKALDTLVGSCTASLGLRETLIAGLRIVRGLTPQLELEGTRASYDVSNQGLPYDRFVLEKVQGRWYIAE
jgi:hypothetical protein